MGIGRTAVASIVGAAVVVGGLIRLNWDHSGPEPINLQKAMQLADCFASRAEIPAGSNVSMAPVWAAAADQANWNEMARRPATGLGFVALTNLTVEVPGGTQKELATDTVVTVTKRTGADFNFLLPKRDDQREWFVEIRRAGARSVLITKDRIRFGAGDGASYAVTLPRGTKVELDASGKQATLAAGTAGTLELGTGQAVVPLQPLSTVPWTYGAAASLVPLRAAGPKGLGSLSIEARHPGMQFNSTGVALQACVMDMNGWKRAGISDVKAREAGLATVLINLPQSALPLRVWPWVTDIEIAVASADGQYIGFGGFSLIDRPAAAVIALLLTAGLFWALLSLRWKDQSIPSGYAWYWGLFIGPDRDPSLSLFQIFIWTVITVWGLAYVFLVTGTLLSLTPEMMALLGIAGTGSVLARWIAERSPGGSTSQPAGAAPKYEFWHMLSSKGEFDLLKLQLFVFTLMISLYVFWRILDTGAFPELDPNTLLLLGISQGVYIGGKVAGASPVSRAHALKVELDVKTDALKNLTAKKTEAETRKATLDAAKAAHGAATPFPDEAKLVATTEEAKKLATQEKELTENIKALDASYQAAVKELKLA